MRVENLSELLKLIVEAKTNEYGPASVGMQKIADAWSSLLGVKIRPHQVALMYAAAKSLEHLITINPTITLI